jgi:hypothetical protein
MKPFFVPAAIFALILGVPSGWAQTAPSVVELAVQAKKLEADIKKQLEAALVKKQEAEAAVRAAAEKKPPATQTSPAVGKTTKSAAQAPGVLSAADAKKIASIAAPANVSLVDVKGMDLETAMMQIQTTRANLLEAQLKDQLASVQSKNDKIAKLNTALGAINRIAAQFPASAKNGAPTKDNVNPTDVAAWEKAAKDAGLSAVDVSTKSGVESQAQSLKSQIDSLSNSQQMDMLRLQSLTNKRNEAFEIMTNFIKKMQDSRASVVGNMR